MDARIAATIILTLIFVSLIPLPSSSGSTQSQAFTIVNWCWGSTDTPEKAYPGSTRATYIVQARSELPYNVSSIIGTLHLPQGFESSDGKNYTKSIGADADGDGVIEPGEVVRFTYILNIAGNVTPGEYQALQVFEYSYIVNGSLKVDVEENTIVLEVSSWPSVELSIIEVYWEGEGPYPGSSDLSLVVRARNTGEVNVDGGDAVLELEYPFTPETIRTSILRVVQGDSVEIVFSGINVDYDALPGNYSTSIKLELQTTLYSNVIYTVVEEEIVTLQVETPPTPKIRVVSVKWNSNVAYSDSQSMTLRVSLQNLDQNTISSINAKLYLFDGATGRDGSRVLEDFYGPSIGYGDVAELVFGPIYLHGVQPGTYNTSLTIECLMNIGGSWIKAETLLEIPVIVSNYTSPLSIVGVEWLYQGSPAIALPNATDIVLRLRIYNGGESSTGSIVPEIQLPKGMRLLSIGGSCLTGIAPGYVGTLDLHLNISQAVTIGEHLIQVNLTYQVQEAGGIHVVRDFFTIPIHIDDPSLYDTTIEIVEVYWGTARPSPNYPGAKIAELTVRIANTGIYSIKGVRIKIVEVDGPLRPVLNETYCSTIVSPSSDFTGTLYFDISPTAENRTYYVTLRIMYALPLYGSTLTRSKEITIPLRIEEFAAREETGIIVVEDGWVNNVPVYPCTENAVYTITIVNTLPFTISGIKLTLLLPEGFESDDSRCVEEYLPGPLLPEQELSSSFRIDVGELSEGVYNATLIAEYVVESGGSNYRSWDMLIVQLEVSGEGELENVLSLWVDGSAGPGDVGSILYTVFRNKGFQSMGSIVGYVELPEGIFLSFNNKSTASILPFFAGQISSLTPSTLISLIQSQVPTFQESSSQVSKGEFIVFEIPLTISSEVEPGVYNGSITISFLDQWGNWRSVKESFEIPVLGSTKILVVEGPKPVELRGRTSNISIRLTNIGSSPIRDVYVALIPSTTYLAVDNYIKYVKLVEASGYVELNYTIYLNPTLPQGYIPGGSMPLIISVFYRDAAGHTHVLNQTTAVILEPFIDLNVIEVMAEPIEEGVRVTGIIVNTGIATARNLEIEASIGGNSSSSFIGDVDPATQTSFSVDIPFKGKADEVVLKILYQDYFYEDCVAEFIVPVSVEVSEVTVTPTPETPLDVYKTSITIAVIVFLTAVVVLLWKYLRKH